MKFYDEKLALKNVQDLEAVIKYLTDILKIQKAIVARKEIPEDVHFIGYDEDGNPQWSDHK